MTYLSESLRVFGDGMRAEAMRLRVEVEHWREALAQALAERDEIGAEAVWLRGQMKAQHDEIIRLTAENKYLRTMVNP